MKHTCFSLPIEVLWVATVLIGVFAFVNTHPLRPHDFWFHAAVGREIVATGNIPEIDTYSYTAAGQPYDSYKSFWLMEVLLFLLYDRGGALGVVFVHGLMITAAYTVIFVAGWRATGNLRAGALGALFAAALGINDWNVRPQAITFVIGALFLLAIGELQRGSRRAWLLVFPLGMLVWVNSHGTFVLGFALLGAWLAANVGDILIGRFFSQWIPSSLSSVPGLEEDEKTAAKERRSRSISLLWLSLLALALTSIACLFNLRGLGVLRYVSGMAANPVIQNMVPEWAVPGLNTLGGRLFYGGLLFVSLLVLLSLRRSNLFQWLVFLGFAALGLKTMRGSIWFGLFLGPIVAFHLAEIGQRFAGRLRPAEDEKPAPPILNWIILAFLLFLGVISLPWFKESLPFPPAKAGLISYETPVRATQVLLENDWPGHLFHAMSFGSYLDWAAQPEYPVFVDSRIELYPVAVWQDFIEISAALPGWDEKLAGYGVNTLMLNPSEQAGLVAAVQGSAQWEFVYEDAAAILFTRRR